MLNRTLCLLLSLLLLAVSCRKKASCPSKVTLETNAYKEIVWFKNGSRTVTFVGMQHIALPGFYTNVAHVVDSVKKEGGYLFYEYIKDKDATDTEQRKFRKFLGILPTTENYLKTFSACSALGMTGQDNDLFLNTQGGNRNVHADFTITELIAEYERQYGTITLTDEDRKKPLNESTSDILPQEQASSIVFEARNRYLARLIHSATYSNIVVTYGREHQKGLLEELKKLDANWTKQ